MIVGLLAIASVGLTLFSLQQMVQEKVIKASNMTEYGYHKSAPSLDVQTPGPVEIKAEDLLREVKHVAAKAAKVRYIDSWDLSYRVVMTKPEVPYVSQGEKPTISSLRGGEGSFSYGQYILDVRVPQSVTIRERYEKRGGKGSFFYDRYTLNSVAIRR